MAPTTNGPMMSNQASVYDDTASAAWEEAAQDEFIYGNSANENQTQLVSPGKCVRGKQIGGGGFGRVYKVLRVSDNRILAGKSCKDMAKMLEEDAALRLHAHAHILKYEGMYDVPSSSWESMVLTEFCAGGDLQSQCDNNQYGLKAIWVLRTVHQIAQALHHLHSRGYFHSDVKPKNIFIRSFCPMNVVLGDCAEIQPVSSKRQLLGTLAFHSPETWKNEAHSGIAGDIWALGICLLSMCGQLPRYEYERKGRIARVVMKKFPGQCIDHVQALEQLNPDNGIVRLAALMLTRKPEDRISAAGILTLTGPLLAVWDWKSEEDAVKLGIESPQGYEPPSFW